MELRPILSALLKNTTAPLIVAIQIAISLAILANALYIVQNRLELAARPSGIAQEENVFGIALSNVRTRSYEQRRSQQQEIRQRLQAIPGVLAVSTVNQWPMSRNGNISGIALNRQQTDATAGVSRYATADSLIATFGLKLVGGRDFTPDEIVVSDPATSQVSPKVVQVTQGVAKLLYPNANSVVGKTLLLGTGADADEARIIGVVEQLQTISAEKSGKSQYAIIYPYDYADNQFAVRTRPGQRDRVMTDAQQILRSLFQEPVIINTSTVEKDRTTRYQNDRTLAWMLISISVFLVLITMSGIVGMSSVWVTQRRKQIGVRRALGARKIDIVRYFVSENLLIGCAGVACGSLLALALNQILVSQLELPKLPMTWLAGGSVLLLLLGVASVLGPALRAAATSPAMATRSI